VKNKSKLLPRFYIDKTFEPGESALLDRDKDRSEYQHLVHSLRLKTDDKVELINGRGVLVSAKLLEISKKSVSIKIVDVLKLESPALKVHLFQSPLKGSRMDWLLEKLGELGISNFHPTISEHTVLNENDVQNKIERWEKVQISAIKQSKNLFLPEISAPTNLQGAIAKKNTFDLCLYGSIDESANNLIKTIQAFSKKEMATMKKIAVFVGPEGGYSEKECELFLKSEILPVSLGYNILRAETAGLVATGMLLQFFQTTNS